MEASEAGWDDTQPVPRGAYVLMTVADDGPGMDEETRRRVFEPFFTTKGSAGNSGLGLATVYGIVQQSGGHVALESVPGRGTTFRLYWPRVDAEATAVTTPAVSAGSVVPGNETILLVEDQPALRELGARILAGAGYLVLTAPTGDEALRLLDEHRGRVDLVITDVVMPGMGGRQLSMRVASEHPTVPVLFMSGYADDVVPRDGLAAQAAHFIAKPYTMEELTRTVRQVLDTAAPHTPA